MAKKIKGEKIKGAKRLAAKMLLSSAAGSLQMFKEYLKQIEFFKGHKDVLSALETTQEQIKFLRKAIDKKPTESAGEEVAAEAAATEPDLPF